MTYLMEQVTRADETTNGKMLMTREACIQHTGRAVTGMCMQLCICVCFAFPPIKESLCRRVLLSPAAGHSRAW